MAQKNKYKAGGFLVAWLILFLIVKSIEKILLITLVVAAGYFMTKFMRSLKKDNSGKEKPGKNR